MSVLLIVVLVAIVVLLAALVGALFAITRKKRTEQAHELRTRAVGQSSDVEHAKQVVASREMVADEAREQADIAEQKAEAARRALAQTEAQQEDTVRAADRVDPAVDHRDDGYAPGEVGPPPSRP